MDTIKISDMGKITIPATIQNHVHWQDGQELRVIYSGDGILLKPKKIFPPTKLEDVAGCLDFQGQPKTLKEIEQAIALGIQEQWQNDCS